MKNHYLSSAWRLLLLLLLPLVSHAQFVPIPGHVYKITSRIASGGLQNQDNTLLGRSDQFALEIGGGDRYQRGHEANIWEYWGGAHQQWTFREVYTAGSTVASYEIINRNSGQLLEAAGVRNDYSYQTYNKSSVSQNYRMQNGNSPADPVQLWELRPTGNTGAFKIVLRANGQYLGVQTGPVSVSGPLLQWRNWDIVDVSANPNGDLNQGVYRIINVLSSKALSAVGNGNEVTQWHDQGLAGQQWTLSNVDFAGYIDPYTFYITNRNTQEVLEIGGGGNLTQNGRRANLYGNWGGQNQKWYFYDVDNGQILTIDQVRDGRFCVIRNAFSDKVLEIGGSGNDLYQDNQPANQYTFWGGNNQRWSVQYWSANRGAGSATASTPTASAAAHKATNIEGAMLRKLALYPNPAHNTLSVSLTALAELKKVIVTDARGGATSARYQGNGQVDVADLAPGLYVVTVSDGQREYRQKFVKE